MADERRMTEAEAHRHFAILYHGMTWDMMERRDRTADDDELMVCYAYASLAHWRVAGTGLNHQRGVWLLSRVHAVLGDAQAALREARRCRELTQAHRALMQDFDLAFSHEALARAHARSGDAAAATAELGQARKAGELITDPEDRKVFFESLEGGDWGGLAAALRPKAT